LDEKIGPTIKDTVENIKDDVLQQNTEEDAVSRLELKEQEYLQEQEETKSEVLRQHKQYHGRGDGKNDGKKNES
jgi:hypothetical protein